jgi:aerobic-type carbon monoxide dehydrogenase small subunit (CoxS/CutS family)
MHRDHRRAGAALVSTPVGQVVGRQIITIEGLRPMAATRCKSRLEEKVTQCGYASLASS